MELREKNSCGHFSTATIKTRPRVPPPQPPPSSPLRPALRAGCCVTGSDTSCGIPAHREGRNNGRRAASGETMTGLVVEDDSRAHSYLCDIIRRGDTGPVVRKQCDLTSRSGELRAALDGR